MPEGWGGFPQAFLSHGIGYGFSYLEFAGCQNHPDQLRCPPLRGRGILIACGLGDDERTLSEVSGAHGNHPETHRNSPLLKLVEEGDLALKISPKLGDFAEIG